MILQLKMQEEQFSSEALVYTRRSGYLRLSGAENARTIIDYLLLTYFVYYCFFFSCLMIISNLMITRFSLYSSIFL